METPKVRLLGDRLLVSVVKEEEQKTASGLIIPKSQNEDNQALLGTVLGISKKIENCTVEEDKVALGETIIFSRFAGTDLKYKNQEYKVLRITDVIGAEED